MGIRLGWGTLAVDYRLTRPAGYGAGDRSTPTEEAVGFWNRVVRYAAERNGQRVEMRIELRLPLGIDVPALQEAVRGWRDRAQVTFSYTEPPFRAEKNTPVMQALLPATRDGVYPRAPGGRPRFKLKTGTSDMNVVGPAWGCPIVAYGPGDSALDHAPDERIALDEFRKGLAVLVDALQGL